MVKLNHSDGFWRVTRQAFGAGRCGTSRQTDNVAGGRQKPPCGRGIPVLECVAPLARGPATRCEALLSQGRNTLVRMLQFSHDTLCEAPLLINAAGAWGGGLARQLGDDVPLQAQAPMLVITARMPHFVDAVVGALGGALSFKQFDNGTVLIGVGAGGAYPDDNRTRLDMVGVASF